MARVLIPLAQGCEELEAVTIIDLLRRAGIEVVTAGLDEGIVRGSRGTQLLPDTSLDAVLHDDYDMLALPGGMPGSQHLREDARVQGLIRRMAGAGRYTAAICAAPTALAGAGVLDGKTVTGYPGSVDRVPVPGMRYTGAAVEVDGKVVTSRGPGTAMDFALTLIELLAGRAKRDEVERGLVRA